MLLLQNCLFPFFLGIGLLAPGWLLGRALGTSAGIIGAFIGSAVFLLNVLLALDALNIPLTAPCVAASLAGVCAVLATIAKIRGAASPAGSQLKEHDGGFWKSYHWLLVPVVIGLSAIVLKASLDPLSSPDTKFRWNFLALQMLQQKSLHFYPAVDARDFLSYGWCDGIPPLVSGLYFWAYSSLGRPAAWATAPIVIGQAVLLLHAVYKIAARRRGPPAGWSAAALLFSSYILLSGVMIGQETGLTALSLITMLLFLDHYGENKNPGWLIWAGIAAGAGGLAREYGLAFFIFGSLCLIRMRPHLRDWTIFLGTSWITLAPAYARNWIKTGNPLFSHSIAGLFPVNPIHEEYMRTVRESLGVIENPLQLPMIGLLLIALGGAPFLLGLISGVRNFRHYWPWGVSAAATIAIWLWSIGQTSGGYTYSMRVLTPAIAVGAVFGGLLLAPIANSRRARWCALFLTLPALDAAGRTLLAPYYNPLRWWKEDSLAWLATRDKIDWWDHHPNWSSIADAAEDRQILVTDPFTQAIFTRLGAKPVSYFSPAVRFLFEPDANYSACCDRLRRDGVRFILIPPRGSDGFNYQQLLHHPFFVQLQRTVPIKTTASYFAYDLYSPLIGEPAHASETGKSTP